MNLRRLSSSLLFAMLSLPVLGAGPSVNVSHVWIRQSPPGVSVLAGYLVLQNLTDKALDLTAVSSPDFGSVEMHRSFVKDGVEQMEAVAKLTVPAHDSFEFKPGSYHLMMMQPKRNLFAGDTVTLDMTFSDSSELVVMAPVRRDPPQR